MVAAVKGKVMNLQKVIIKKYENRRLYDTTNSRYVNLDEVADMLRRGIEVQAIDAASGEDITRLILTQIIVDGAKDRDSGLPLDILRQMVVASGRASQETLLRSARSMLEMYQNAYGAFSPAMTPFDFMQMMMRPGARPPGAPAAPEPASPPASPDDSQVTELRQRIDELERIVASVAPKGRKRAGTKKKSK
jgi:polyhydroxyalkanoate synthesis repressor PhaR